MKFIGPFLRINSLNKENISSQLFHLSKESLKHIVLQSKCGIPIAPQELNKHMSKIDINTIKHFSPLLCIYKKASAKLYTEDHNLCWKCSKFKREVPILGNSLMTLSLLELYEYYNMFQDIDKKKYELGQVYLALAKCQLEFYACYLRNIEGVFIDKIHTSDLLDKNITFEDKNKRFKFSEQALLMNAYYKYSSYFEEDIKKEKNNYAKEYRKFSLDILTMFKNFKNNIYEVSTIEKLKICLGLNLFYKYSKIDDAKLLILDLYDLILDEYDIRRNTVVDEDILCKSLLLLNSIFVYRNLKFLKAEDISRALYNNLISLYNEDLGLYFKNSDDKEIKYSSTEITSYLFSLLLFEHIFEIDEDNSTLENIFKNGIVNSGIVLSWPDAPTLNDAERYKNFSKKSNDLLEDDYFRMPTLPTPENNELAPVFIKRITYNKKKNEFKQSKSNFYSNKNFPIFFMSIFFYNNFY